MIGTFIGNLVPDGGGAIWLGVFLAFVVFGDFTRLWSRRNIALAALLVTAPFLNDIQWWWANAPTANRWIFTLLFLVTIGHTVWAFLLARPKDRPAWEPNLPVPALKAIAFVLVALNTMLVLHRRPEDAGHYINVGAQRWMETGLIPYADSLLVGPDAPGGGAASTYGPLLYIAHMPGQILLGRPVNRPDANIMDRTDYIRPNDVIPRVVCLVFYLAGLVGLYLALLRLAGRASALGGVILYAGAPIIWGLNVDIYGLGSGHGPIGGLTYVSHIAPSAMLLLAIAAHRRPALSGALFAAAAGVLYYPAFAFPAWLGWRIFRKDRPIPFAIAYLVTGAVTLGILDVFTPGGPVDAVKAFMNAAFGHQEGTGPRQYGATTFGFWGTHPGLAGMLHDPLFGTSALTSPVFLVFLGLCVFAFYWMRRGGTIARVAAITAALAAAIQLWKAHGVGTYYEWYLPLLILALVAGDSDTADPDTGYRIPDTRAPMPPS